MKGFKVSNFREFVNEKYVDSSMSEVLQRFYFFGRKSFPTDSPNVLGKMIGSVRNTLFDQIDLNFSNMDSVPLQPNVPILNFNGDGKIVQEMLDKKIIEENSLYNHPSYRGAVANKSSFHRKFAEFEFVPRTVFSVEDASKLQFPIIAKPSIGKSAKGIRKFSTMKELRASTETFDIFSEMIDIKREFRCFCFRGNIISIDERLKIEGSDDFLANSSTTTDFYYEQVDPAHYDKIHVLNPILKECRKITKLDFFSVDFAETADSKIFVIEMNSSTGMGVEKMVELYKLVHKDFYKRDVPDSLNKRLESMKLAWVEAYKKEKSVNECTTLAGSLENTTFLFKNRDRSYTPHTVVVREKYKETEIAYYTDQTGWIEGMNEHGVGFVISLLTDTQRKGYKPSWYVSDEPKVIRLLPDMKKILIAKNAREAIKIMTEMTEMKKSTGPGRSFLVGDKNSIFEVEVFKGKVKERQLNFEDSPFYVKSNHGFLFPEAGHQPSGDSIKRSISTIRKHQAEIQLKGTRSISEIPSKMKFQAFDSGSPLNVFRTDPEEHTISQCMMNLTDLEFYVFHDKRTADSIKVDDKLKNGKIRVESREV